MTPEKMRIAEAIQEVGVLGGEGVDEVTFAALVDAVDAALSVEGWDPLTFAQLVDDVAGGLLV